MRFFVKRIRRSETAGGSKMEFKNLLPEANCPLEALSRMYSAAQNGQPGEVFYVTQILGDQSRVVETIEI